MYILRVFTNEKNKFGNKVGVVIDENKRFTTKDRLRIMVDTGFSECVFVNDLENCEISIFNPKQEIDFAGHAVLGVAYLYLNTLNKDTEYIRCKSGPVSIRKENNLAFIKAEKDSLPEWNLRQLQSTESIEEYQKSESAEMEHTLIWAWDDKVKGKIRARTFASDWGIPEDEANGSGVMTLASKLNRPIEVMHGKGSVIFAKPINDNAIELGGRVILENSIHL